MNIFHVCYFCSDGILIYHCEDVQVFFGLWVSTCCKLNKSSDSEILRQILMLYWDRGCVSHVIISSHIGGDWELLVEIWTTFISNVTTLFITPHNFVFPLSPIIVKNLSGKRISFDGDGVVLNNFSEWKCLQFDNLNEGLSEYQTHFTFLFMFTVTFWAEIVH